MFFVTEGTEGGRAHLAVAKRGKSGYKNVEGHNTLLFINLLNPLNGYRDF